VGFVVENVVLGLVLSEFLGFSASVSRRGSAFSYITWGMSNTALLTSFTEMVHLAEGLRLYALLILKAENSLIYLAGTQTSTLSKMD
jgi:hypothetical protein